VNGEMDHGARKVQAQVTLNPWIKSEFILHPLFVLAFLGQTIYNTSNPARAGEEEPWHSAKNLENSA
jgi:hypothetical protein